MSHEPKSRAYTDGVVCPDCGGPLWSKLAANGTGNDLSEGCDSCGYYAATHSLYRHNSEPASASFSSPPGMFEFL